MNEHASLAERPLLEAKLGTTPAEFARRLRSRGGVFWWEPDGAWVITDHGLATDVLKGSDFSADRSMHVRSRMGALPPERAGSFLDIVSRMMCMSDPPRHTERRKLASHGVAEGFLCRFNPMVEHTVEGLIAAASTARRSFDFVSEIALPLPYTVLADLFCIPPARRAEFYFWSDDITRLLDAPDHRVEIEADRAGAAAEGIRSYFRGLVSERRAVPQADFISRMLASQESTGLDDEELIAQAVMLLVAGSITSTHQIGNDLFAILTEGPSPAELSRDPLRLEAALEESARLDPTVNFISRMARTDTLVGHALIRAGQLVLISVQAANRDPAVFEEPDRFRVDRVENPHLAHGGGIHKCLGVHLARFQIYALFSRLFRAFPGLVLDPHHPPVRKHRGLILSGFESLWVRRA